MELEGVINHNIFALKASYTAKQDELLAILEEVWDWEQVQKINSNEHLCKELKDIRSIKQLVSRNMQSFLGNTEHESLMYQGFSLQNIQKYMELRNACNREKGQENEVEAKVL